MVLPSAPACTFPCGNSAARSSAATVLVFAYLTSALRMIQREGYRERMNISTASIHAGFRRGLGRLSFSLILGAGLGGQTAQKEEWVAYWDHVGLDKDEHSRFYAVGELSCAAQYAIHRHLSLGVEATGRSFLHMFGSVEMGPAEWSNSYRSPIIAGDTNIALAFIYR